MRHAVQKSINNPRRETTFWISVVLLALVVFFLDRSVFFVYIPRWLFVIPLLLLLPTRVNKTYWARFVAVFALCILPFVLAPVRWNLLKSFYLDCERLEVGMPFVDALDAMSIYESNHADWIDGARMWGISETDAEHQTRRVVIPSRAHSADWCVLYPEDGRLARVVAHPD